MRLRIRAYSISVSCLLALLCTPETALAETRMSTQNSRFFKTWQCATFSKLKDQVKISAGAIDLVRKGKRYRYQVTHQIPLRMKQETSLIMFLKRVGKQHSGVLTVGPELHLYHISKGILGMVSPQGGYFFPKRQTLAPGELARRSHVHWKRWSQYCYAPSLVRSWAKLRKQLSKAQAQMLKKRMKNTYKKSCQFLSKYDSRLCMREGCMMLCWGITINKIILWMSKHGIHPLQGLSALMKSTR